jgi:hypothetical protein
MRKQIEETIENAIEALASKASTKITTAIEAMQYTQSCVNLSNALCALQTFERNGRI